MSTWLAATLAAGAAASSPSQRAQCAVPACEDQRDTHGRFLPIVTHGDVSPRAARRHLAVSARCAYRADPRRTAGTVEQLRKHQRDGGWCRLQRQRPRNKQLLGDWVAHGGERYFLPYKWEMPNTAYYLAPAAFSQCTGGRSSGCTEEARTLVRVWGCVVARCWRANHSPYNATAEELWPAGTWPTHV
jgi:hypothetical protein